MVVVILCATEDDRSDGQMVRWSDGECMEIDCQSKGRMYVATYMIIKNFVYFFT